MDTFFASTGAHHLLVLFYIFLFLSFLIKRFHPLWVHARNLKARKTILEKIYYAEIKANKNSAFIIKAFKKEFTDIHIGSCKKTQWNVSNVVFVLHSKILAETEHFVDPLFRFQIDNLKNGLVHIISDILEKELEKSLTSDTRSVLNNFGKYMAFLEAYTDISEQGLLDKRLQLEEDIDVYGHRSNYDETDYCDAFIKGMKHFETMRDNRYANLQKEFGS